MVFVQIDAIAPRTIAGNPADGALGERVMAEVVLDGVSQVYPDGTQAVDSLDLVVGDQELLVLLGPSGCGKSTTLRMIAGLDSPADGTIRIAGQAVNDIPPRDRDIAMVFQNYALYPHMTVRDNLGFGLRLRCGGSWPSRMLRRLLRPHLAAQLEARRAEIPGQIAWAAEVLGIEPLLDRLPRQLSGGERQRVALGRAMVRQPAVFLFDEPLSNLDAQLRVEMRREIKRLHQQLGATMIYVTHDQVEALTLGDRVAVMQQGILQQVGTVDEIYDTPSNQFVAGFIGSPPMNLVPGEISLTEAGGEFKSTLGAIPITGSLAQRLKTARAGTVMMGVRAEDIAIRSDGNLPAVVTSVEPLGDSKLVSLQFGHAASDGLPLADKQPVVGRVPARAEIRDGQAVQIVINESRLHWFDPISGKRLAA